MREIGTHATIEGADVFHWAAVNEVQARVGCVDRATLRGLATSTDGLLVLFFPPSVYMVCGEEFVNRTYLHDHDSDQRPDLVAPPALAARKRLVEWCQRMDLRQEDQHCALEFKKKRWTHNKMQRLFTFGQRSLGVVPTIRAQCSAPTVTMPGIV